ncbi:hypothetical protein BDW22DRAFT_1320159 [Trametopsis cervina]|nr:hypothetical protein BDW22DRAFT_1320159 [Trametopsis cervina]
MSNKIARSHTNKSNRVDSSFERRIVYRSVLDNPFTVAWPKVPGNVQNAIISQTVAVLNGVASYHIQRQQRNRKRKSEANENARKRRKLLDEHGETVAGSDESAAVTQDEETDVFAHSTEDDVPETAPQTPEVPVILQHITCGINEVTKKLEELILSLRQRRSQVRQPDVASINTDAEPVSQLVLACTGDVNPPCLIEHLPNLVAACNSVRRKEDQDRTWLVPLPAGAEETLSAAVGLRRVSVLLVSSTSSDFGTLRQFLNSVSPLCASWLQPTSEDHPPALVPTHIKQLKTTAPKDMKAAKERRTQHRTEAKKRRKQNA